MTRRQVLETFKFTVYLAVPVVSVVMFSVPWVYETAITKLRYIVYDAEAVITPTDEFDDDEDIDPHALPVVQESDIDQDYAQQLDDIVCDNGSTAGAAGLCELAKLQQ